LDNFKDFDEFTEEKKEAFYKLVGKNVSRIRKKHKLSQLKLSKRIEIFHRKINNKERPHSGLSII